MIVFAGIRTATELRTLRESIVNVINALNSAGHNGPGILAGITFKRTHGIGYSITLPENSISLDRVNQQTIWHEIAHSISFRNDRAPQDAYYRLAESLVKDFAFSSWFTLDKFCYREYCEYEYSCWQRPYTGLHPEYWSDAFSAWVYWKTYGKFPVGWIRDDYEPIWSLIRYGVDRSLGGSFKD